MDIACSFHACRGTKLTTTALIHSSSPPGFIANQKELSTRGKVKAHNGCVVTENDKIILLKRVYTSPVRRSSRVRRKGCLVISTPLPKRRHSVPAHTVTVNSQQPRPRCCPKSAESAPLNAVNGETTEAPDVSPVSNLTSPPTTVKEGFQWSEETPRRRLSVRITETAEIRKKLAEAGMPRLSFCADPGAETPGQFQVLRNRLSQDVNYAPPCGYGDEPCEPKAYEYHPELSKCDTKSMFDPSTYLGSVFPDLQCTNSSFGSDEIDSGSKNVVGSELLSSSKTSRKSQRVNSEEFMNGFFHASSESSMEMESVDSSDELSRDAGDEVLCISPLLFENSEMNFSFTPIQAEQSRHLRLELPKCLLSEHEQQMGSIDVDEFLASPSEMSSGSSPVSSISADATVNCSLSSRSPGSILRVDLGRNNPLSPLASPAGSQSRCRNVEYPSPRKNGMRPMGLLKLTMSSPASTSTDTSNLKSLEYPDQLTDDVCIVNLTPNNRVYNSLKDKEPSPTYASQANTESPSSPRNTSIVSEQNGCKQYTQDPLSTQIGMKQNAPLVPLKSPIVGFSPDANDFQDFSEFDFQESDESILLAQAKRQTEVFSKPVSPENVLSYSFNHLAQSSDDGSYPLCHSDHHRCVQPSKESVEVSSLPREVHVCDYHQQQIENNKSYAPAYHKPSVSNSISVKDSDKVWMRSPDFLLDDFEALSKKKSSFARRSSMRIAKRMSLLTAEVENKKDEEKDSGKIMQLKTTETSKLETMVVVKRKRGRPKKIHQESQINNNHCLEKQNVANPIPSTLSMETQSTIVASNPYVSTDITLPVPGTEEQLKCQFDDDPMPNLVKRSRRKSRRCSARLHPDLLPLAAGNSCSNTTDSLADGEVMRNNEKDSMLHSTSPMIHSCRTVDESATTQLNTHDQVVSQELPETKIPSGRASDEKSGGTRKRRRSIRLLTASLNQEEDTCTCAPSGQILQEDEAKALNLHISPNQDVEHLMNNFEADTAVQSNVEPCYGTGEVGVYSENVTIEIEKENEIYTSTLVSNLVDTFSSSPNNGFVDISQPFYADLAASSALEKASSDNSEENATSSRPKRRRSGITLSSVGKIEVKCKKRRERSDEEAVKELYLKRGESKALKQSNLETIFEEVHIGKTGSPVYAGSRKCKRAVTFLEHPWLPRKRKKHQKDKICQVKRKKKSLKDPNIDKKLEALLADLTLSPSLPFTSL